MAPRMRSLMKALARRSRFEGDMQAELRAHLDEYTEHLVRSGLERAEAERRARLEFGSMERVREECRQARGLRWFDECVRNLRYAGRLLRKNPGFTAAAVLTLALSIGANTAVFSVVDAAMLRPLPYPEPGRLASVVTLSHGAGIDETSDSQTGATWELIRDRAFYLDAASYGMAGGTSLVVNGRGRYVQQSRVSAGYFGVLGVAPLFGREFTREEDRPGGPCAAVVGYPLWKRVFAGDSGVIGKSVVLRGEPCTVVGVMPESFRNWEPGDIWTPLHPSPTGEGGGENYGVMARLKPGVSWQQAEAQIGSIGLDALRDFERRTRGMKARLSLTPFQQNITREAHTRLFVLLAAAALTLLMIGCTNIAGLLLARGANRRREIATRMALGGGRGSVVRQLLTESLALSFLGGALGIVIGHAGARGLVLLGRGTLDIWQPVRLDVRVLGATLGLSLLATILSGILPALVMTRMDPREGLAEQGSRIAGARTGLARRILIVAEVALGMVLLTGAGLLIRSLAYLQGLAPGFEPAGVVAASVPLRDARYGNSVRLERLVADTLDRLRRLPRVESAAMGLTLPFERPLNDGCRRADGPNAGGARRSVNLTYVSPDYFETLRIPVRQGRAFSGADTRESEPVAIVNESCVRRLFPDKNALGGHITFGGKRTLRIVGIVGDVQQKADFGGYEPPVPAPGVFIPVSQTSDGFLQLVHVWFTPSWIVRSPRPEGEVAAEMAGAIEAVDPLLPVAGSDTMRGIRAEKLAPQRTQAILLGIMAALALLLAAIGIYGLVANTVTERTRELGIRMALGAGLGRTIGVVARTGFALALAGVGAGFVAALFAVRLLRHFLWGVAPTDAVNFAGVAAVLLAVAGAASVLPALRLGRLNPAVTLRQE